MDCDSVAPVERPEQTFPLCTAHALTSHLGASTNVICRCACGWGLDSFLAYSGTSSSCASRGVWSTRLWSRACCACHPHSAAAGQERHPHCEHLTPCHACRCRQPASLDMFSCGQDKADANCDLHVTQDAVTQQSMFTELSLVVLNARAPVQQDTRQSGTVARMLLCQSVNGACCGTCCSIEQ